MKKISILIPFIVFAWQVLAQQGGYQIGQKVEAFTLPNETGQQVNLQDLAGNKAVVIVFTNNRCPYSRLYHQRLQKLKAAYGPKNVTFLFIKSAIGTETNQARVNPTEEKTKLQEMIDFPYLTDANQKVSRQFGATKTPEVFVLQPENNSFTLRYKGAIDDNPQVETYAKEAYLQETLDALLRNQAPAITQKRATGCMIKHF